MSITDAAIRARWTLKLKFRQGLYHAALMRGDSATASKRIAQIEAARKVILRHTPAKRPYEVIIANVRNQSLRMGGTKPTLIVLHSTESHNRPGINDLGAIVSWFNNPAAQASSHVVVDDEGHAARCVPDARKAWHVAQYNSKSLGIEQIGAAAQGRDAWTEKQLRKVARYLAYWNYKYGIPLEYSTTHGVRRHMDLGAAGGGHHDPGVNYPFDHVIELARQFRGL